MDSKDKFVCKPHPHNQCVVNYNNGSVKVQVDLCKIDVEIVEPYQHHCDPAQCTLTVQGAERGEIGGGLLSSPALVRLSLCVALASLYPY